MKTRAFVDAVTIRVRAGNGGHGCSSFRREKFVPLGGPDGGDGGRGGHVTLQADHDTDSLVRLYFAPHVEAGDGGPGRGAHCTGRNGKDLIVTVPLGTEVRRADDDSLLGDLVEHGQTLLIARGGTGGLGNLHFKSATNRAPTTRTEGERGECFAVKLTLKLMADIGLVGFPNAGKSSLLGAISEAHPKVAAYPFTTLHPIVGTLVFPDYTRLTLADIPGLVPGAHQGIGLGDAFLRHVERAAFLVYVIDMAGTDGRDPWDDLAALRRELALYRAELTERPSLVVANKMDVPEAAERYATFVERTGLEPLRISAATGLGLETLKETLRQQTASRLRPTRV